MRCKVQVVIETGSGESVHEIARLDREAGGLESIGLTLAEAKTLLAEIQAVVVQQQAAEYLKRHQHCPACGKVLLHKGAHALTFRTLFGNLTLPSPRLFHCTCQPRMRRTHSVHSRACWASGLPLSAFTWKPNGLPGFPSI